MKKILLALYEMIMSFFISLKIFKRYLVAQSKSKSRLEYAMLLTIHSLEKGMGLACVKKGYGIKKAMNLLEYIETWEKKEYPTNQYCFQESIMMMNVYIHFQEEQGVKIDEIKEKFYLIKNKYDLCLNGNYECGYKIKKRLEMGKSFDFEKFIRSRHSVREFSNQTVEESQIRKAVDMARFAPSACNRQPVKVYYSVNRNIISKIEEDVPGNRGFEGNIDNYLVVTGNMAMFGPQEFGQWWLNGGEFLAYLQLGMHALGVGSCQFQWPCLDEKRIRSLLKIPEEECIVGILGIGNYKDEFKVNCAERRNVDEILRSVN